MGTSPLRWLAAASLVVTLGAISACGNSDPLSASGGDVDNNPNSVVIGSASFPESETIADVYAEALRANGFDVTTKFDIGTREAYIPAVRDGSIDVVPDYTGNLLQYLDKGSTATSSVDVDAALGRALGSDLTIATPAAAEDKDAVVVTRDTAQRWKLTTITDLASHSTDVKFGASAEFQERSDGLPGLKKNYRLDVSSKNFVPIADGGGPATVRALTSGAVTAADIFTTSPAIAEKDLVVLADPKHNFPAQNVVPVIRRGKRSTELVRTLDAVSAHLTTEDLVALNESVSGAAKVEPKDAAQKWVADHGLDKPIS